MPTIPNKATYLILIVLGAISVFAYAPFNRGICIIISLLGLLWFMQETSVKQSVLKMLFYAIGFFGSQVYWVFYALHSEIGIDLFTSALGTLAAVVYLSLYLLLVIFLFKKLSTRSNEFNYLILFPSCWVFGEWLRGWFIAGFSWSDISYTQVNNFLLQGYFPLLGSYGVSWLSLSIIGFLFLVIINHQIMVSPKPQITRWQRLSIVYFVILAISGYYLHGKEYTQSYGKLTKVALLQGNLNGAEKWDSKKFLEHLDMYASMISRSKADIIILPETAIQTFAEFLPEHYLDDIINLAKLNHAELVVGLPRQINAAGDYVNSATVFTQAGYPYYAKAHLVPFGEYVPLKWFWGKVFSFANIPMTGFSPGGYDQAPLTLANQKLAFNICYENGFGSELINSASQSTLMVNLSDMVWFGDTIAEDQHLQISQARALENQRYFIQATSTGLTAIINSNGQVVTKLPDFEKNILQDYVQGRVGVTPYQRYGNYPIIILSFIILGLAGLIRLFTARRMKRLS